jgi:hypothetical protein
MTEENQPQFPSYPQPAPQFADPKHSGKLFKMVKFLMKPKPKIRLPKRTRVSKKNQKAKFF